MLTDGIKDFLATLHACATDFRWDIVARTQHAGKAERPGLIRGYLANAGEVCPITAIALQRQQGFAVSCWLEASVLIGLSLADTDAILKAADGVPGHQIRLRKALLAAVGLPPTEAMNNDHSATIAEEGGCDTTGTTH